MNSIAKKCTKCERLLTQDDFYYAQGNRPGYRQPCKECTIRHVIEYQKINPQPVEDRRRWSRKSRLKRKYGLTGDDFDEMVRNQNGLCAICQNPPDNGKWKNFCVDHSHTTDQVRSLLCSNCNIILGVVENNISTLNLFVEYLDRHSSVEK